MRIIRIALVLALAAAIPAVPSGAAVPVAPSDGQSECDLFLLSGAGIYPVGAYFDDPASIGCEHGRGVDTSILMPGALAAGGYVRGDASSGPPTDASITVTEAHGRESRTPVTFTWWDSWWGPGWYTDRAVYLGPTAVGAVIVARFGGRLHRHAYHRIVPPEADGPSRSGTIAVGIPPGTVDPVLGPPSCQASPECRVWLASGCIPRLGGRDPALTSSIVDVRGLAGSTRRLVLGFPQGAGMASAWEFWTSDCRRIGGARTSRALQWSITIPRNAQWMTVTAPIGPYSWELW